MKRLGGGCLATLVLVGTTFLGVGVALEYAPALDTDDANRFVGQTLAVALLALLALSAGAGIAWSAEAPRAAAAMGAGVLVVSVLLVLATVAGNVLR